MLKKLLFCFVIPLISPVAVAQTPGVDYERVLLPVVLAVPAPGAFGSTWMSMLWAMNEGSAAVDAFPISTCAPGPCIPGPANVLIPPGITFQPQVGAGRPGMLLYVDRGGADALRLKLRVQDLSRQAHTWGTEIPVIRERDAHTATVNLFPVPNRDGFRNRLRIYDFDPMSVRAVRVRLYALNATLVTPRPTNQPADTPLGEGIFTFRPTDPHARSPYPAFIDIADLAEIAPLGAAELVRIEVEPLSPGTRFWAFVAITNNETQHVTLVTPR